MLAQLDAGDYLLLQNEISNLTYLLRTAVRHGLRVVLNASPISDELLKADLTSVDWLVVNEIECAAMAASDDVQVGYETLKQRYRAKHLLVELTAISAEIAQMVVSGEEEQNLPNWFLVELVREIPALTKRRNGT